MKTLTRIIAIFLIVATLPAHADEKNQITHNQSHKDNYSWDLSDDDQTKQAVGIVTWGIFFTAAIAIISCLVPSSPSDKPTTNGASSAPISF